MLLYTWQYAPVEDYLTEQPRLVSDRVIDDACSVVWCERQNEPGSFAAQLRATPELLRYFTDNNIVLTRKETGYAMLAENIELTTSTEDGDYLTISGRSAEAILNFRAIYQTETKSGNADDLIYYFVKENASDYWYYHTDSSHIPNYRFRYINLLRIAEHGSLHGTTEVQPFGQDLGQFVSNLCKAFGFGYKVAFNNGFFDFSCYQGTDRSLNQSAVPAVVFSPEFENLGNTKYTLNRQAYYNRVIVAGEGEGKTRTTAVHSRQITKNCGFLMREKFIDKKNISSNSDGISSSGDYASLLGKIAVAEADAVAEKVDFNGEVLSGGQYKYRENYYLGDKVSVVNGYGITGTATVSEVVETEDESGYRLIPTFTEMKVN